MASTSSILVFFLFGLCQATDVNFVFDLGDVAVLISINRFFAIFLIVEFALSCCVCLCDLGNGSCGPHTTFCACLTCLTIVVFLIVFIVGNNESLGELADARLDMVAAIIGVPIGACCLCCCCLLVLTSCSDWVEHAVVFDFGELKEVASGERRASNSSESPEESTSYMAMATLPGGQAGMTLVVRGGKMYWCNECSPLVPTPQMVTTPVSVVACAASAEFVYVVTKEGQLLQTGSLSLDSTGAPQAWVRVAVPVGIKAIAAAGSEVWAVSTDSRLYKSEEPLDQWILVTEAAGIAAITMGPESIYALRGKQGGEGQLLRTSRAAPAVWEECQVPHALRAISACHDSLYGIWEDFRCKCKSKAKGPPGQQLPVVQQVKSAVQIGSAAPDPLAAPPAKVADKPQEVPQPQRAPAPAEAEGKPQEVPQPQQEPAPAEAEGEPQEVPQAPSPAEAEGEPQEVTKPAAQAGVEGGFDFYPRVGCAQPEMPLIMSL